MESPSPTTASAEDRQLHGEKGKGREASSTSSSITLPGECGPKEHTPASASAEMNAIYIYIFYPSMEKGYTRKTHNSSGHLCNAPDKSPPVRKVEGGGQGVVHRFKVPEQQE